MGLVAGNGTATVLGDEVTVVHSVLVLLASELCFFGGPGEEVFADDMTGFGEGQGPAAEVEAFVCDVGEGLPEVGRGDEGLGA